MNWIDRLQELAQQVDALSTQNRCRVTVRLSNPGLVVRVEVDGRGDEHVVSWFELQEADPNDGVEARVEDRVLLGLAKVRRG